MPVITFQSGQLRPEIRDQLLQKLTETAADITGIPKHLFITMVQELPDAAMAVGGTSVTELKRLQAEQAL